jgi:large subunit ribosomal protein L24
MKLKIGDKVLVTSGKDKGKKSEIIAVFPALNKVLVKDINLYFKHIKPFMDKPGERRRSERSMSVAKVAILNDKDQADRIAYKITADGKKERIFKKTGQVIKDQKVATAKKK